MIGNDTAQLKLWPIAIYSFGWRLYETKNYN